jgi:hypothetical protein
MSFSVDLWNGLDIIKSQFNSTHKKLKILQKLLSSYVAIETNCTRSLDEIFKQVKETGKQEYLLDEFYLKIIEILNLDNQKRKDYILKLKEIVDNIYLYIDQPKPKLNRCLSENSENTEIFNKQLNILIDKQKEFHNQCKELCLYVASMGIDEINKINNKTNKKNCQRSLERVKSAKEEYLNRIFETNKARENYNSSTEKILKSLEEIYHTLLEKFKDLLIGFADNRMQLITTLYEKEKEVYDEMNLKLDTQKEMNDFIVKNATKMFPLIKFEFCPIKEIVLKNYIKSKYTQCPEKDLKTVCQKVKEYFDINGIFKDSLMFRSNRRTGDFFSVRKLTIWNKSNNEDSQKDKYMNENRQFLENYITELITQKENENNELLNTKENNDETQNKNKDEENKNNNDNKIESNKDVIKEEKNKDNIDENININEILDNNREKNNEEKNDKKLKK